MPAGQLRVYLRAAPGVGKTYKMLEEGHRRLKRGTDVVVGFVECHGRPLTEALVEGLEVVPRRTINYRGASFTEMDVDAVLARAPQVVLVDEMAHTNVPGSRNAKRWQDIQELLDAGIVVVTTVNIQHLESLNDVVQQITGVPQRETVPDAVVRRAEQIELVDMTPEALRRRMAHGNIYAPEKVDAALGLPLLTYLLALARHDLSLPSDILIFLAAVVVIALVGGRYPALVAALTAFLLLNYYFTPPIYRWTIAERENVLALTVFLAVAATVSLAVDLAARRTGEASRARAEAETLSTLAGSVLRGSRPLPALLDQLRETFQLTGVTLLERRDDAEPGPDLQHNAGSWRVAAAVGDQPCLTPAQGDVDVAVDDQVSLVLRGRSLPAADRRVVEAFAAQAAIALRQERLEERVAAVGPLAEIDKLRTALLSAVSHDLRTPLASAKAAVDSLRSRDVEFSDEDRTELLDTAEEALDRLSRLVENLLDMSRLQAGALAMSPQLISLAEALPRVVDDLGPVGWHVGIRVPDDLPEVHADPALLERALANVLSNALRYSPADQPPIVTVSEHGGHVEIRVIDHGPGTRLGPGVPAVPAPRRPRQRYRRRPRPRAVPRPGGGHGRHARPGADPRRRPYYDAAPAGGRTDRRRGGTGRRPGDPRSARPLAAGRAGSTHMTRVLIVDDEPQILRALRINLHARGYDVVTAADGAEALHAAAANKPDLVVLDLGLPDVDGVEVIRKLRTWTTVPILILSGRMDSAGKVDALDAGADDYVTKPFNVEELLARIRAVTRRHASPDAPSAVRIGRHTVDLTDHRVAGVDGATVHLTPIEWQLLEVLVRSPGKLVSQRQLLQQVWGPTYQTETEYLRQYMKHLRRKLEDDPARPRHLLTEPGMGYRFQP
jgi:two-component system sensor histidine kinase KdpD